MLQGLGRRFVPQVTWGRCRCLGRTLLAAYEAFASVAVFPTFDGGIENPWGLPGARGWYNRNCLIRASCRRRGTGFDRHCYRPSCVLPMRTSRGTQSAGGNSKHVGRCRRRCRFGRRYRIHVFSAVGRRLGAIRRRGVRHAFRFCLQQAFVSPNVLRLRWSRSRNASAPNATVGGGLCESPPNDFVPSCRALGVAVSEAELTVKRCPCPERHGCETIGTANSLQFFPRQCFGLFAALFGSATG